MEVCIKVGINRNTNLSAWTLIRGILDNDHVTCNKQMYSMYILHVYTVGDLRSMLIWHGLHKACPDSVFTSFFFFFAFRVEIRIFEYVTFWAKFGPNEKNHPIVQSLTNLDNHTRP